MLIALHVTAVVVVACPAPVKGSDPKVWRRPGVRAEVAAWTKRLRALGFSFSESELSALGQKIAQTWSQHRDTLVAPARAYVRALGTTQGWYMFTAPDRLPQRFSFDVVVAGEAEGVTHKVFELGRAVFDESLVDSDFLDEHRVRRAFFQAAWSDRPVFREICAWLTQHAAAQRPDVQGGVCRLLEEPVVHPDDASAPAPRSTRVVRTLRLDRTGRERR